MRAVEAPVYMAFMAVVVAHGMAPERQVTIRMHLPPNGRSRDSLRGVPTNAPRKRHRRGQSAHGQGTAAECTGSG